MRKVLALAISFTFLAFFSLHASVVAPSKPAPSKNMGPLNAANVRIPIGNTGKTVTLLELSTMNVADVERLTGKKLGWVKRLEFSIALRKLRHSVKADGTIDNKKFKRAFGGYYDDDGSFHIGGFALGFFVGLIGVLIAYLINDDLKHRRVKWAWIGFGCFVVIYLAIALAVAGSM